MQVEEATKLVDEKELISRKTAACAVSLGVDIIRSLVGKDISGVEDINDNEMMTSVINSELKL